MQTNRQVRPDKGFKMKLVNFLRVRFPVTDSRIFIEVNGVNYGVLPCPATGRSGNINTYEGITLKQLHLLVQVFPEIMEKEFEIKAEVPCSYPSGWAVQPYTFTLSSLHNAVSQSQLLRCLERGQLID